MPSLRLGTLLISTSMVLAAVPGLAAPRVAADIAPIHSIVASVMAGVGAPTLIVPSGVSEHGHALRPSEAAALEDAEVVIWVGPSLTPWLEGPLDALAPGARRLTLVGAEGVRLLPLRVGGPFEAHDDSDHAGHDAQAADHGDAHGAEVHDDQAEAGGAHAPADADDHDHGQDHTAAAEGHAHGAEDAEHSDSHGAEAHADEAAAGEAADPHIWLDPQNAAAIASVAAAALAEADPANAEVYAANAARFAEEMATLGAELETDLARLRGRNFFVFHDAYLYFEDRFGLPAAGAIALGDGEAPRAGRLAEIRERFTSEDIACVFAEPQYEPRLIATLIEGTDTRTGVVDPIGSGLEPGPALYPALMRGLAAGLAACLDPPA
jgi:zinc transport system substrate-binding protein